ncbi:MAG: hypothetical protein JO316_26310 [Abitibacteriaceae bacterium]|nr:hypothetical protein [Abditibacteriaceae bacterium]
MRRDILSVMQARGKIISLATGILLLLAGLMVLRPNPVARYQLIVQQIQQGVLTANKAGVVRLPAAFSELAPRGEVYAERKADGRLFVLFPTWYGRGADMEGYLFCSQALRPSDYYAVNWGAGRVQSHIDVAGRDMLTVEPYKPNWYTRRLD